jgi:hypothetical protein
LYELTSQQAKVLSDILEKDKHALHQMGHLDDANVKKYENAVQYLRDVSNGNSARTAGMIDAVLEASKTFDDNVLEIADVGLKNWKTFQNRVAEQLNILHPDKKIGNQITLDVTYIQNGVTSTKTIIPDNLIQIEANGVKKYKVIDAKTANADLVSKSDLTSTCTKNQQDVYPLIDGTGNGTITKVEMRGGQAQNAFGENVIFDANGRAAIQLDVGVEFWVNSSTTDFTRYAIRARIK